MGRGVLDIFARWSPAQSETERLAYLQARIALYCKMMFLCFVPLLGYINVIYAMYPQTRPAMANTVNVMGGVGLIVLGAAWLLARQDRVHSRPALLGLDAASVIMIGAVFGTSAVLSSDRMANVYSSFIWGSFAVFGRVLVVPSTGTRTLVLSAIGMTPLTCASLIVETDIPTPALFAGTIIFAAVTIALSTTGSHVLYGLRAQVSEAMQLGQYTIGEKIGEGGMGAVYKAQHAMLRRPTAIKLLLPDRAGIEALRRFEREVQRTAELTHPNTVAVFDYGRSPDGIFYYAMEYLDGVDLETLVRRHGPQDAGRVIHIVRQVCGALVEAHGHGLIHRDIKPGNVILCERGGVPDIAKVLDFGLVKEMEADDDDGDSVSGTPAYIAPEAINAPDQIGPASDLYAVGAVAYFMLTGTTVFEARSVVQILLHHTETPPVPPSARCDREIPADLEAIVMQCLEKRPDARPPGARELIEALDQLENARSWTEVDARAWWTEHQASPKPRGAHPTTLGKVTVDLGDRAAGSLIR